MRWLRRFVPGLVVLAACSDAEVTSPENSAVRPDHYPAFEECQFSTGVTLPGTKAKKGSKPSGEAALSECYGLHYYNYSFDDHRATGTDDPADPALPEWEGQSFAALGTDEARFCPVAVSRPHFQLNVPGHGILDFILPGVVTITYENSVRKEATYALPPGRFPDTTGRYWIEGGTITGSCWMWEVNLGLRRVIGGWMSWYPNYTGMLFFDDRGISPIGGSGTGWAYKDTYVFVENGAGDGWRAALDKYLEGGGCTYGWEIWKDGNQKCDRYGRLL